MERYCLTPSAVGDLEAIYDYIASDSLHAAGAMLERFTEAFRKLGERPGMGHLREDLTDEPFRFWAVGAYLIIDEAAPEGITILRIVHGARDVLRLLQEERD